MRKLIALLLTTFIVVMAAIACQRESDKIEEIIRTETSGDEEFYSWLATHGEDIYEVDLENYEFDYTTKENAYNSYINRYNHGDYDMAIYIAKQINAKEKTEFDQLKSELMVMDAELQSLCYNKDSYGNLKGVDNDYFVNMDRILSIIYELSKSNLDIVESDNYMSSLYDAAKRYVEDIRDNVS